MLRKNQFRSNISNYNNLKYISRLNFRHHACKKNSYQSVATIFPISIFIKVKELICYIKSCGFSMLGWPTNNLLINQVWIEEVYFWDDVTAELDGPFENRSSISITISSFDMKWLCVKMGSGQCTVKSSASKNYFVLQICRSTFQKAKLITIYFK